MLFYRNRTNQSVWYRMLTHSDAHIPSIFDQGHKEPKTVATFLAGLTSQIQATDLTVVHAPGSAPGNVMKELFGLPERQVLLCPG